MMAVEWWWMDGYPSNLISNWERWRRKGERHRPGDDQRDLGWRKNVFIEKESILLRTDEEYWEVLLLLLWLVSVSQVDY